jgi:hypothetical protein
LGTAQLTFCNILHISLITKTSDLYVSTVDASAGNVCRRSKTSSLEIETLSHNVDLEKFELEKTENRNTNCVNFQVGEFGSPSTIFYDPCGGEDILAQ